MTEIPPEVASLLAHGNNGRSWLRRVIESEFRRNGGRVPYPLERWLDHLEAHERGPRNSDVSTACSATFPPLQSVSVTEYARTVGTSPQAVRGKCRRGTLPATLVGGQWRITIEGTPDEV